MMDAVRVAAAIDVARRRMREKANSVRNAYSTQRNKYAPTQLLASMDSP
jgi:hypothetical protein